MYLHAAFLMKKH